MHATLNHFSGAVLACCLGAFGLAHAADVKPAAAPQAATASSAAKPAQSVKSTTKSTKSTKSAKSSKPAKSATTKSATTSNTAKTGKTAAASAPATAKPAAVAMPAQTANPYLSHSPRNQYLPTQPANPYLAYRSTSHYAQAKPDLSPLMALLPADAQKAIKESRTAKVSLRPLPVDIFMMPNQKPTVAFTTPCAMVEKATNGFPVFTAMTNFMYTMAGNINESNALPIIIEPVCV